MFICVHPGNEFHYPNFSPFTLQINNVLILSSDARVLEISTLVKEKVTERLLKKNNSMNRNGKPVPWIFAWILLCAMGPSGEPQEIPLWPTEAPGSEGKTGVEKVRITQEGDHVVSNIHNPSITPYLPSSGKSSGVAVIVAPGGGHRELWIDHEGYRPAHWLQEHGIAAFVLKYRLAREENSTYTIEEHSLADIQRAIRLVRSRAKEWSIDTSRVGVMGFSAGGELAAIAAMRFDKPDRKSLDAIDRHSSRPDFQALIYPGNSDTFEVTKNSPPLFLAGGYNDRPDISKGIAKVYLKYKEAGIPAELHIYATAGHGFGIRDSSKGAVSHWLEQFAEWLSDLKFLNRDTVHH